MRNFVIRSLVIFCNNFIKKSVYFLSIILSMIKREKKVALSPLKMIVYL